MAYVLVDLARHRFDPSAHPRVPGGESGGGRFTSVKSKFSFSGTGRGGAHLTMSDESSATRYQTEDLDFSEHSRRIDMALTRAQQSQVGTTENDHAWDEVSAHLETLNRKVQTAKATNEEHRKALRIQGSASSFDASLYRLKSTVTDTEKVKKVEEFGKETEHHVALNALTAQVATIATRVAGGAAALIGAGEAERFTELFHRITENPEVESAINVSLTILVAALIARIQKAVKRHKDKKITRARGQV
jgi:hypothetical protein